MGKVKRKMEEKIEYKNGVQISFNNIKIFLDPIVSVKFSIVSHAHADHCPYLLIDKPIATEQTEKLIKVKDKNFSAINLEYNKKLKLDEVTIEFIDAKHILGSSMILIENEKSILYTGDFRNTDFDEEVDILIIESTYGKPEFIFPDIEEEIEKMIKWINSQTIYKKVEIGAYPIGKAQEIIKILNEYSLYPSVTKTIKKFNEVYENFGEKLIAEKNSDIIVRPFYETLSNPLPNCAHCLVSGWGIINKFNFKTFIISDHLDFKGLVEFVENVNPKIVYTYHGFSKEFAEYLNKKGIKAFSLI